MTSYQVSVGSANPIWRLYQEPFYYELSRFNPKTLRYTPIIQQSVESTSETLKFIDAGADGTLWGIAENGDLYRWDEEEYQFVLINTALKPNL